MPSADPAEHHHFYFFYITVNIWPFNNKCKTLPLCPHISVWTDPVRLAIRSMRAEFGCHNPSDCVFLDVSAVTEWQRREELYPLTKSASTNTPTSPPLPPPPTKPPLPSHTGIKTTFCWSAIWVKHFLLSHEPELSKLQVWFGDVFVQDHQTF